jgi:predicted nuclease of predicted toxin-antitoxin system
MRFLVDAQLPAGLAAWLGSQGHFALHVSELGLTGATDEVIWAKACETDCHVITKDEDFVVIRERAGHGPAVIWLRIGNAINRVLIDWLSGSWPSAIAAIEAGAPIIEIT